ncbi:hypothetical protein LZ30DRAFT_409654 [Colletotrichum cereale]|nr:hypothetical protein LZ30DRAFT_409654 [Colletotrichum cereale]
MTWPGRVLVVKPADLGSFSRDNDKVCSSQPSWRLKWASRLDWQSTPRRVQRIANRERCAVQLATVPLLCWSIAQMHHRSDVDASWSSSASRMTATHGCPEGCPDGEKAISLSSRSRGGGDRAGRTPGSESHRLLLERCNAECKDSGESGGGGTGTQGKG